MTAPFKLKHLIPSEDSEAQCLVRWAQTQRVEGRRLSDLLIMIPNGAVLAGDGKQRAIQMARMKRCGFKNGVSDYVLTLARGRYHALFLELKRRSLSVVSQEQTDFQALMQSLGYAAVIVYGWEEAMDAIQHYLREGQ